MKRNSFTLCELVLVVAVVALFAVVFSGCGLLKGQLARAQSQDCVNNLKQMSTVGFSYCNDNRGMWQNSESKSYAWSLAKAKYMQNEMPPQKGNFTCCPSVKRDPGQQGKITEFDQSDIQMYASVGDHRPGQFNVVQFNSPRLSQVFDHSGAVVPEKRSSPSDRIWFCDGLRPDTQRPRTLLITESSYTADRPDCARPYAVHGDRINIATHDGAVVSINPKNLKDYHLPCFKTIDASCHVYDVYSVRANTYISPKDPKQVLTIAD